LVTTPQFSLVQVFPAKSPPLFQIHFTQSQKVRNDFVLRRALPLLFRLKGGFQATDASTS